MSIRGAVFCLSVLVNGAIAVRAEAASTLRIEVREPKRARLVSADIWIRNSSGKLLRKVYASGGRAQVSGVPSGTLVLEVKTRSGTLYAKTRVSALPNRLVRVGVKLGPPPKTSAPRATSRRTARAKMTTDKKPRKVRVARHKTARATVSRDRRSTAGTVAGMPGTQKHPAASKDQPKQSTSTATVADVKDWGRGKRRVCRGDVYDNRGRRISGRLIIRRGSAVLGSARVNAGRFSLYDLKAGTYRLEFSDAGGKRRATSTVAIKANKLPRVVLRAR